MAGSLSLYGAGQLVQSFFSRNVLAPEIIYVALIRNTPPTPYMSGAEIDEVTQLGYQRVGLPNDVGYWTPDTQPQIVFNASDIQFNSAGEDWGAIRYWALCDAQFEGNTLAIGTMETVQTISSGDIAVIGAGDLSISLGS